MGIYNLGQCKFGIIWWEDKVGVGFLNREGRGWAYTIADMGTNALKLGKEDT